VCRKSADAAPGATRLTVPTRSSANLSRMAAHCQAPSEFVQQ
jgi:hypothetical protein